MILRALMFEIECFSMAYWRAVVTVFVWLSLFQLLVAYSEVRLKHALTEVFVSERETPGDIHNRGGSSQSG